MALFNAVCNRLSETAWETKTFRAYPLQELAYHSIRVETGLPAQLTIRAIAKVADSYKADRSIQHVFGPRGAVVYDARCFKMHGVSAASLTTVHGRFRFSLAHGGKQRAQLAAGTIGEADLLFRDGIYYFAISVKTDDTPPSEPDGFLGVDLGIKNIAADSDGTLYAGGKLRHKRKRHRRLRHRLQALGTRGARRLLVKRRRKERRHATHANHRISKKIVAAAEGTGRGVAVEDLTGIRDRTTVGRASRDGDWHRDSQFVTRTDEEERQFLFGAERTAAVQLQIALLPSEDSEVVPGSHRRWDTPEEYRIRKGDEGRHRRSNEMPGAVRVRLEPGDAVAFNPRALHRGRYHTDKPRRTLMLTYTSRSGEHPPDYFNRQPWFLDPDYLEPHEPRTRTFFGPFVERFRDTWGQPAR